MTWSICGLDNKTIPRKENNNLDREIEQKGIKHDVKFKIIRGEE